MRATFTLFPEEITANKVPNGDRTWANLEEASEAYDCERYIRADVHKATVAENERLRAALAMSDQALKQKQISEVQSTLPATIFETHPLPWRAVSDDHCYQDLVAANNALIIHNSSFCPVIAIDLSQIAAIANALISKEDA